MCTFSTSSSFCESHRHLCEPLLVRAIVSKSQGKRNQDYRGCYDHKRRHKLLPLHIRFRDTFSRYVFKRSLYSKIYDDDLEVYTNKISILFEIQNKIKKISLLNSKIVFALRFLDTFSNVRSTPKYMIMTI